MPPDTEPGHPDAAGWALSALDPVEAETFETHLRDCAECQATVAGFASVVQALRSPVPAVEPSPDLGARVVANIQRANLTAVPGEQVQKAPTLASLQDAVLAARQAEESPGPAPAKQASRWHRLQWHRLRWHWRWSAPVSVAALGAAAAAIAVVVLAVVQGGPSTPALAGTVFPLHARLTAASTGLAPAGQAVARHSAGGWQIHLTVRNLPPLSGGRFYEVWYARPGSHPGQLQLISAGTFTVGPAGNGTFTMWSAANPNTYSTMQITEEPAGEAGQHGKIILSGSPRAP